MKPASPEQLRDWLLSKAITLSFLPTPIRRESFVIRLPEDAALRTLLTGGINSIVSLASHPLRWSITGQRRIPLSQHPVLFLSEQADLAPAIGRPLHTQSMCWIPSYSLNVAGELYIGGDGLARATHRPDLTAERFIPNPFKPESGRLYKTGDLVRYQADGNIDFISP